MSAVIITVASIEWPTAGRKTGTITDTNGKKWGVWPEKLPLFQTHEAYEITFKSRDYQGKTYYTIDNAQSISGGSQSSAIPIIKPVPPPHGDDQRRMDIFVCGAFNNIMGSNYAAVQDLTVAQMVKIVNDLKTVWKRTLGPQAQETLARGSLDNDMDDEIPF